MNNIAASDQILIDAVTLQQRDLNQQRAQMQKVQNSLAHARQDFIAKRDALQLKLSAAKEVLDALARDRATAEYTVEQLKSQRAAEIRAAELAAALASYGWHPGAGAPTIAGAFANCPVDQPHAYVDSFGAPRFAGGYHPHAGNDIMAPRGTPIRAPFDGMAADASNGLGGMSVKVFGADGWVYNAHLSKMGHLGKVKAGDVIGYVGDSGDARGGATHDHFEWHPYVLPAHLYRSVYGYTTIDSAIDPYPYLNAVC
jgi:murein DD-endopeptidase MepM/ murein hydrolase activator NlpD